MNSATSPRPTARRGRWTTSPLTLPAGAIIAVIGLNGAGKTTLLRCLGGIVAPTRGGLFLDGERFRRDRLDLRRRLAFLPDFPALFGHHHALQHIALLWASTAVTPSESKHAF